MNLSPIKAFKFTSQLSSPDAPTEVGRRESIAMYSRCLSMLMLERGSLLLLQITKFELLAQMCLWLQEIRRNFRPQQT